MFNGKNKAITFSFDDGTEQDIRLIKILNKNNLKATFNLNSEFLGQKRILRCGAKDIEHNKNNSSDVKSIYYGHEVAAHTLTHQNLVHIEDDNEIIRQVEQDRRNLSELVGYEVVGMAYPCGSKNCDARVAEIIEKNTGIKYARSFDVTESFEPFKDLYRYEGTLYIHGGWDKLFDMGKKFLDLNDNAPKVFYLWGHAFEFDIYPERWEEFEEFCKLISNRSDIFYGTNKEVLCQYNAC